MNVKKFFRLLVCPIIWIPYFIFSIAIWFFPLPIIGASGILGLFYSIVELCLNPMMKDKIEPFDGPLMLFDNSFLNAITCLFFPAWFPVYACWYFYSKGEFLKDDN